MATIVGASGRDSYFTCRAGNSLGGQFCSQYLAYVYVSMLFMHIHIYVSKYKIILLYFLDMLTYYIRIYGR